MSEFQEFIEELQAEGCEFTIHHGTVTEALRVVHACGHTRDIPIEDGTLSFWEVGGEGYCRLCYDAPCQVIVDRFPVETDPEDWSYVTIL